jgi:hypothetical protein
MGSLSPRGRQYVKQEPVTSAGAAEGGNLRGCQFAADDAHSVDKGQIISVQGFLVGGFEHQGAYGVLRHSKPEQSTRDATENRRVINLLGLRESAVG